MSFSTKDPEGNPIPDSPVSTGADDGHVTIDPAAIADADDADDGPAEPTAARPGQKSRDKRGGRMRELEQSVGKLSQDFGGFSSRIEQLIAQAVSPLQAQLQQMSQPKPAPASGGQSDQPSEAANISREMGELLEQYANPSLNEEARKLLRINYNRLHTQLKAMERKEIVDSVKKEMGESRDSQNQDRTGNHRTLEMLEDEFPELWHNVPKDEALNRLGKIRAYVEYQVGYKGRPKTSALFKEAAAQLKADLNLGPTPAPSRDRGALATAGTGRRAGAGTNGALRVPVKMMAGAMNATGLSQDQLARYIAGTPEE